MYGIKWKPEEVEFTRAHAKAIIAKKSRLYTSTKYLVTEQLSYRSFASVMNRIQKDIWFLSKNPLEHIAAGDIDCSLLPRHQKLPGDDNE